MLEKNLREEIPFYSQLKPEREGHCSAPEETKFIANNHMGCGAVGKLNSLQITTWVVVLWEN